MPAVAWEDGDGPDSEDAYGDSDSISSRRHPERWRHDADVTAVLSSDWGQDIDIAALPDQEEEEESSHPPLALSWMAEASERHGRGALDAGGGSTGGTCPPRSSAAPVMCELALEREHEREVALPPRSRSQSPSGPMLRRAPPTQTDMSSAAHAFLLESSTTGNLPVADAAAAAGSSFLGALSDSYSLWELASVLAAIAWLLVYLAA
ncbi:hypothetical protein GSI_15547 [Ganoderma sinense ZZ0214-1]|uniref:Uncharacterized protein n=1 Tax=Ganoderma sinense ZZ0214-1 TaxID=1077348 RepID=A0A2G8RMW0_9APHY|nr:hypothetical protein GSI_15547 [Ganoderma sinense ZZ0214-1]